jgi:hypothetical protein
VNVVTLKDLTDVSAVQAAIDEYDRLGRVPFLHKYGFGRAQDYFLIANGRRYDSKAIVGAAYGYQFPQEGPLSHGKFSGGEATVRRLLERLGFTVEGPNEGVGAERIRRQKMLDALLALGDLKGMSAQILRDLGIYGGAQGIWVDQKRTGSLTGDGSGVAVGVLHTGQTYADDLSDKGLIYHYPNTDRGRKDEREAQALRNAEVYKLPLFVILHARDSRLRDVRVGWVANHDDSSRQCLILFEEPPGSIPPSIEEVPFRLTANRIERQSMVTRRERSPSFKFGVIKRCGEMCAFCEISNPELLDAAHIRGVAQNGSDDDRNGLILCANHHKAFDKGLIGIRPPLNELVPLHKALTLTSIGVTRTSLSHLRNIPHPDAICWRWNHRAKGSSADDSSDSDLDSPPASQTTSTLS